MSFCCASVLAQSEGVWLSVLLAELLLSAIIINIIIALNCKLCKVYQYNCTYVFVVHCNFCVKKCLGHTFWIFNETNCGALNLVLGTWHNLRFTVYYVYRLKTENEKYIKCAKLILKITLYIYSLNPIKFLCCWYLILLSGFY